MSDDKALTPDEIETLNAQVRNRQARRGVSEATAIREIARNMRMDAEKLRRIVKGY